MLLVVCVCVCVCVRERERERAAIIFGILGGWVGVLQLLILLCYSRPPAPPPGPALGDRGIRPGSGEGQRSAGSGFQGDSVPLSPGEE